MTRSSTESTSDDDNEEVKEDALGRVVVNAVVEDASSGMLNERGEDGGATMLDLGRVEARSIEKTLQELNSRRSVGIIVEKTKFPMQSRPKITNVRLK